MKKQLFTLMLLLLGTLTGHAQFSVLNGDLNHDGKITVEDVTMMTNIILEKNPAEAIESATEQKYVEVSDLAESAELMSGCDFNTTIKQLVNPLAYYETYDTTIKKITFHQGSTTEGTVVSSASSLGEARAVYNAETQEVDIYVAAKKLVFPEDCNSLFYYLGSVTQIDWSAFGSDIYTSNVTNMSRMFSGCSALTTLDVSNFDTSNVTDMSCMFNGCWTLTTLDVSHFDTSNVADMHSMFNDCEALTTLDVSHFDTSNVTDMSGMFAVCEALTTLDLSHFNTSNVTSMGHMFGGCKALTTLDVSHFDTSNVTYMSAMFSECKSLTTLDVSSFDTSNVMNMSFMFNGCSALTTLDVSNFDTSNVMVIIGMFEGCQALTTLDVSNFDTSKVTYMGYMFKNCSALTTLDVSHFNTSKVWSMLEMFKFCYKLSSLKLGSGFTIADGCDTSDMLYNTPKDADTPNCTITCTAATKAKLLDPNADPGTRIDESKFSWDII